MQKNWKGIKNDRTYSKNRKQHFYSKKRDTNRLSLNPKLQERYAHFLKPKGYQTPTSDWYRNRIDGFYYGSQKRINFRTKKKKIKIFWFPNIGHDRKQKRPRSFPRIGFSPMYTLNYHKKQNKLVHFLKQQFKNVLVKRYQHSLLNRFHSNSLESTFRKRRKITPFLKKKLALLELRLFYGIFSNKKYVLLIRKKAKADSFQSYLFSLMERRLDVSLYRCNFAGSIYSAQQLIRHGHVTVNGVVIRNFFYPIQFYQKVSFASIFMLKKMQHIIFAQLRLNRFRFRHFSYIVINYLFMFFYLKPILFAKSQVSLNFNMKHSRLSYK